MRACHLVEEGGQRRAHRPSGPFAPPPRGKLAAAVNADALCLVCEERELGGSFLPEQEVRAGQDGVECWDGSLGVAFGLKTAARRRKGP